MAKSRIITARLRFSPKKAGEDMNEAALADWLANVLNFSDGLDVATVMDRGDTVKELQAALVLAIERLEICDYEGEEAETLATIRAALRRSRVRTRS